ncbi:hypothetical protein ALC56_02629 [Trachymyrmex septentrionalis]|uniref:Uncharacterized protein n=1 Tax=Trachymyrmex septentrionalis TaxID=34720 RepID=A0A195FRB6_9HYME|nr:hypothetical protein ALC56_02629 [Trachymyrmex septentrionalis]
MGATVLLERRDKGEEYIERRGESAKRRWAGTHRSSPPPSFPLFPPTFVAFHPFHPPAQPLAHPSRLTYLPPLSRAVSLPLPLSLGLYLEMLPPTNKPQTLRSFTQS